MFYLEDETETNKFETKILFRETCYDDDMKKFKLACLDAMLEPLLGDNKFHNNKNEQDGQTNHTNEFVGDEQSTSRRLSTVRGCMQFISHNLGGQNLLRRIEQLAHDFEQRQSFSKKLTKSSGYVQYIVNRLFMYRNLNMDAEDAL